MDSSQAVTIGTSFSSMVFRLENDNSGMELADLGSVQCIATGLVMQKGEFNMIHAAVQVADRLTTLLPLQGEQDETVFTGLIDPIFRDAESVVYGYTSFYLDLIMAIYSHAEEDGIIQWLEVHRNDFMPLRIKVRALSAHVASDHHKRHGNDAIGKLKQGMLGLMQGSVSLVEEYVVPLARYGYSGPTLLHQLYNQLRSPFPTDRSVYVDIAKKQFQATERAWEEAVEGYAALKFALQAARRYETRAALLID